LTVAVVLTPFAYEGRRKGDLALSGLSNLRDTADTVIVVSNERLKSVCDAKVTMKDAFRTADGVLIQGVRGIADLILKPGIINGDFADVEAVLRDGGEALIGTGTGRGEDAVMDAVRRALACPLLERAQTGAAANVMVSITADWELLSAAEIETAMNYLQEHYADKPNIKMCMVEGEGMEDRVLVTVLASGFDQEEQLMEGRRNSLHLGGGLAEPLPTQVAAANQAMPVQANSGRIYGDVPANDHAPTPTRLLPQAPTPSGEVAGFQDDLHVPAIIRLGAGRLPIE
ncbi:MAG TPA: cell division protein FtsZ, partial [Holophagaceae bacterium]